jgi:hypothetical protein
MEPSKREEKEERERGRERERERERERLHDEKGGRGSRGWEIVSSQDLSVTLR